MRCWCDGLEFEIDEEEGPCAFTKDRHLKLTSTFDFEEYTNATRTIPFPPMFQLLVQTAIENEICQVARFLRLDAIQKLTGLTFSKPFANATEFRGILPLVAKYADMTCYSLEGTTLELLPHQIVALEYSLARKRKLLAMEMGLGKTYTFLATFLAKKFSLGLIACPSGLKANWKSEIKKFFVPDTVVCHEITEAKMCEEILSKRHQVQNKPCIFIVSYSLLAKLCELLHAVPWEVILCDEAHALKNPTAQCSKAMSILSASVPELCLLTATASPTNGNMYHLLQLIQPEIFKYFWHNRPAQCVRLDDTYIPDSLKFFFAERYLQPGKRHISNGRMCWDFRQSVRQAELHFMTRQFVLTQKVKDFLSLPPFIREHIVVGRASKAQKRTYEQKMQRVAELAKKNHLKSQALFMEAVLETSHVKLPFVLTYLTQMLETNDVRFIVFAHHKFMLTAIDEHLTSLGVKHITVRGDTSKTKRPQLFKDFETDLSIRCAVLSITACGVGLNVAYIHLTIYAEIIFNYIVQAQSEGRTYRIGQTADKVVVQYLILDKSTDNSIIKSTMAKANNESLVLSNKKAKYEFDDILHMIDESQPDIDLMFMDADCDSDDEKTTTFPGASSGNKPSYVNEQARKKCKIEIQPEIEPNTAQIEEDKALCKLSNKHPRPRKRKESKVDEFSTTPESNPADVLVKPRKPRKRKEQQLVEFPTTTEDCIAKPAPKIRKPRKRKESTLLVTDDSVAKPVPKTHFGKQKESPVDEFSKTEASKLDDDDVPTKPRKTRKRKQQLLNDESSEILPLHLETKPVRKRKAPPVHPALEISLDPLLRDTEEIDVDMANAYTKTKDAKNTKRKRKKVPYKASLNAVETVEESSTKLFWCGELDPKTY
jgi:hypothetical protein